MDSGNEREKLISLSTSEDKEQPDHGRLSKEDSTTAKTSQNALSPHSTTSTSSPPSKGRSDNLNDYGAAGPLGYQKAAGQHSRGEDISPSEIGNLPSYANLHSFIHYPSRWGASSQSSPSRSSSNGSSSKDDQSSGVKDHSSSSYSPSSGGTSSSYGTSSSNTGSSSYGGSSSSRSYGRSSSTSTSYGGSSSSYGGGSSPSYGGSSSYSGTDSYSYN